MLTLTDSRKGLGRRDFLHIGGLGLGGLTLSDLLQTQTQAANGPSFLRDKSVVFLFMHGGPSQIETFDPKMTAPPGIHSVNGEVATRIPGITFGSTLKKLSALNDQFSIVRSFVTGDGRHDIKPIVSRHTADANLGSIYSRVAGANRSDTGMPTNVALYPRAVDPKAQPANMNFGKFGSPGGFGTAFSPFVPGGGGDMQSNMQLKLPRTRLTDRQLLLQQLDGIRRLADESGAIDGLSRFRQQAFDTILGGAADAFDLSKEDPRTLERYDTARILGPDDISKKWNNYNNYCDNAKTLGHLLLLARRLCERGCGFVTVTTNFVWDMHSDVNNAGVEEGMRYMGIPFDHAVSAFLEDVAARGLSEKILLVCCGEMGRTPRINKNGGRDHWGGLAPLMLAGGGLKMGQVVGQSARDAGTPLTRPYQISDLVATVLHTLFDTGELRLVRGISRDVTRIIESGNPISELV